LLVPGTSSLASSIIRCAKMLRREHVHINFAGHQGWVPRHLP
jgi:hypothetical protein